MLPRLLLFTDRNAVPGADLVGTLSAILDWVPTGSLAIVLAESDLPSALLLDLAEEIAHTCRACDASLYINGRWDIARAVEAGVHLSPDGLDPRDVHRLGRLPTLVTTNASSMVARHARYADAVIFGPVYPTLGARYPLGAGPKGPSALAAVRQEVGPDVPVYAYGGITPESAEAAFEHGASGIAVMSAVLADLDPVAAAACMVRKSGQKCQDPRYLDSPLAIDDHL